jgi:predicted transposase YdaD
LKELNSSDLKLKQNIRQLEVLAKISDLQLIVLEEEKNMALTYDMETDVRFVQGKRQGIEEGLEKGIEKTAIGLLKEGIDLAVISKATGLSREKLVALQKRLKNK